MLVDHRFANLRSTVFVGIGQHVHDLEKTDQKVGGRCEVGGTRVVILLDGDVRESYWQLPSKLLPRTRRKCDLFVRTEAK